MMLEDKTSWRFLFFSKIKESVKFQFSSGYGPGGPNLGGSKSARTPAPSGLRKIF